MSFNSTRLLINLLTVLVAVVLAAVAAWVAAQFVAQLLLLFVACILAYVLYPPVIWVQARLHVPRPAAIALLYLSTGAAATVLGYLFVPAVVEQAGVLQKRLPGLLTEINGRSAGVEHTLRLHGISLPVRNVASDTAGVIGGAAPVALGEVLNLAASVTTTVFDLVLILVMSFYLINDGDKIGSRVPGLLPGRLGTALEFATRSAGRIVGRYVRAQLAVAAMVGVLGGAGAAVLGVQYAPLIGAFAFLAESVPVLGPIVATVPAVVIALLETPWPWRAVAVLAWFVVVQQLEQNVIVPRLSGHAVGIHPVAAIMAVLAGYSLGSVWGALFAVPLLGFVVALAREAWRVYLATPALSTSPPTGTPVESGTGPGGQSGPRASAPTAAGMPMGAEVEADPRQDPPLVPVQARPAPPAVPLVPPLDGPVAFDSVVPVRRRPVSAAGQPSNWVSNRDRHRSQARSQHLTAANHHAGDGRNGGSETRYAGVPDAGAHHGEAAATRGQEQA